MRLTILTTLATAALAAPPAHAGEVIVVPFSGQAPGAPDLANSLSAAAVEVFELEADTDAQLARAPRADILTLAACPDEAADCIGQLAATLDVDRAAIAAIAPGDGGPVVELQIVSRDGAVASHSLPLGRGAPPALVARFKTEMAKALGLAPAPEPAPAPAPVEPPGLATPSPGPDISAPSGPGDTATVQPRTWTALGLGALGLGLGSAFLVKADRTEDAIRSAPDQTAADIRTLRELEDRGDVEKTTGAALLAIGGAAAATGAALLIWDLTRAPEPPVSAGPTDGGVAVTVRGRF